MAGPDKNRHDKGLVWSDCTALAKYLNGAVQDVDLLTNHDGQPNAHWLFDALTLRYTS